MMQERTTISQRIESLLDFDKRVFFLILVIFFLVVRFLTNDIILRSIPGYSELEGEGSFTIFHIFNTLNYLWTPFSLLWKFTLTAFIIWTGSFAFGYKVPFMKLWHLALFGELIFLLPEIIKLIYFIQPQEGISFQEIRDFYPLSLYSLFNSVEIPKQYHYPLRSLNIFELIYIGFLTLGFHSISRQKIPTSFLVILGSYVSFFLLWLLFYILVYK
ncbi:hypothetical protein [Cecembia lonarensis]|uniref:Sulfate ABC transporter permease n=1 Tax=Cecembia lonarensis (strain CCUG 58316 / KCTC 22772 / LW9) TaxID=1225176 RepID=K1KZY1_CECL9|nr:hypothetical protein [Cecembia lonarensis]EKB49685.1 hypothetical protein B879_01702 [Cecembia lonarensis LW9]